MNKTLLIVTPIFPPAPGGASTYYNLLARGLIGSNKIIQCVVILTERMPGLSRREILMGGRLVVLRLFPHRAGGKREPWMQYVKYALQNVQYFFLGKILKKYKVDFVLMHTGFYNFPNLMWLAVFLNKKKDHCKWVADMRDWLLPPHRLKQLDPYDAIIACSENIIGHLEHRIQLLRRCNLIPVIADPAIFPDAKKSKGILEKYGLKGKKYLAFIGLIKKQKGLDLLYESFLELTRSQPDLYLVLVGSLKEGVEYLHKLTKHPNIYYLGPLPHGATLTIVANATLCVNLSPAEGMPRSSLEALALGVQVALPPNIPEFMKHCPEYVISESHPKAVAGHFSRLLESNKKPCYPLINHDLEGVLTRYLDIFEALRKE